MLRLRFSYAYEVILPAEDLNHELLRCKARPLTIGPFINPYLFCNGWMNASYWYLTTCGNWVYILPSHQSGISWDEREPLRFFRVLKIWFFHFNLFSINPGWKFGRHLMIFDCWSTCNAWFIVPVQFIILCRFWYPPELIIFQ